MKILVTLPCAERYSCCAAGAVLNAFTRSTLFSLMTTLSGRPVSLSFSSWRILETQRREGACTWTHSKSRARRYFTCCSCYGYQHTAGQKHSDTICTVVCDTGNTPKSSPRPLTPETTQDELPYSRMLTSALELVFTFHTGCDEYLHKLKQPCHPRY